MPKDLARILVIRQDSASPSIESYGCPNQVMLLHVKYCDLTPDGVSSRA